MKMRTASFNISDSDNSNSPQRGFLSPQKKSSKSKFVSYKNTRNHSSTKKVNMFKKNFQKVNTIAEFPGGSPGDAREIRFGFGRKTSIRNNESPADAREDRFRSGTKTSIRNKDSPADARVARFGLSRKTSIRNNSIPLRRKTPTPQINFG